MTCEFRGRFGDLCKNRKKYRGNFCSYHVELISIIKYRKSKGLCIYNRIGQIDTFVCDNITRNCKGLCDRCHIYVESVMKGRERVSSRHIRHEPYEQKQSNDKPNQDKSDVDLEPGEIRDQKILTVTIPDTSNMDKAKLFLEKIEKEYNDRKKLLYELVQITENITQLEKRRDELNELLA